MLMRAQIGQLFVFGFEGTEVTPQLRRMLTEYHVGGLILFRPNVEDVEQLWRLTGDIAAIRPDLTPAIFVDEEGGSVSRLPAPVLRLPPMRTIGRAGDEQLLADIGETLGRELSALGIHVNLSPVVDVDTNPSNPVIGPRSYHSEPQTVAELAVAHMRGLHRGGVTACPKHFPGHGDTNEDSHHALPSLHHSLARLDACEFVPFRAVVGAGARMLMTAHILLAAHDPVHPATLSPLLLSRLLRQHLGFAGLVISDDLGMAATADRYTPSETVSLGVAGAIDLFLLRGDEGLQLQYLESAIRLAETDPGARVRMAERAARVLAWKRGHVRRERRAANLRALNKVFTDERRSVIEWRVLQLQNGAST